MRGKYTSPLRTTEPCDINESTEFGKPVVFVPMEPTPPVEVRMGSLSVPSSPTFSDTIELPAGSLSRK